MTKIIGHSGEIYARVDGWTARLQPEVKGSRVHDVRIGCGIIGGGGTP